MTPVEVAQGSSPVILGLPHTGTHVPSEIMSRLNEEGRKLRDTDWRIHRLYGGLLAGATTVRATFHRYCIDANRDPSGASLYPGQNTTDLVPTTDFDNQPIWSDPPTQGEIADRVERFHRPYHAALQAEIARVKALHGVAIVYDCHSIRSACPFLFDGLLSDFNIGTDEGRTCDPAIEQAVVAVCADAGDFTHVVNGRFRGGWTTRRYGRPDESVHAIQMELAQATYLETETPPFAYDEAKAARLRIHLKDILQRIEAVALGLKTKGQP